MKKEIIIHIGAAKCGSTAIQDFLDLNHAALRQSGVLVPGMDLTADGAVHGNHILFFEQAITGKMEAAAVQRQFASLLTSINQEPIGKIVFSAENLANHPSIVEFIAQSDDLDVVIVFYVRRQDDFIISYWYQWGLKAFDSFADYLDVVVGEIGDWHRTIGPWEAAFGRDRVRIRPFRRDRLVGGDVVTDFCATVGIDCPECTNTGIDANRSMNEHLGEMANRIRDVFEDVHDKIFLETFSDLIGPHAFKSDSRSFLMDLEQRTNIYRRHQDGNEEIKRRYFPDWGSSPLFEPPSLADCSFPSEAEKLRAESALLLRAVYGLALRLRTDASTTATTTGAAIGRCGDAGAAAGGPERKGKRRVDAPGPWARHLTKKLRKASRLLWPGT